MKKTWKSYFWISLYFILTVIPLVLMLVGPHPPQREFWREVAVGLGFIGLSLMGIQFIPTARLKFLTNVFPMDMLYEFHHWSSVAATVFIVAHPLVLIANNPKVLILFDLVNAPWRARAGITAGVFVVALTVISVWRLEFKIKYELWRYLHNFFAIGAAGLTLWHIFGVNYHLGTPIQRFLWVAFPAVWVVSLIYTKLYKPWEMLQHPYQVKEVREERGNSWTLAIDPVEHKGLTFKPGQVAWLTIDKTPFVIREHPFSFTSSAEHPETLEFTIKELGDFTSQINQLKRGTPVYVDGPYGIFSVDEYQAPGYVFIAGGIGSAPFMSMLRTLADRGDQRPLYFFYGNLNWEQFTFREELADLEQCLNLKVIPVLEKPALDWEEESGYITADILDRHLPEERQEFLYLVCGPLPMFPPIKRALNVLEIPNHRIHQERYKMA